MSAPRFVAALVPPPPRGEALWFAFRGLELLVVEPESGAGPTTPPVGPDMATIGLTVIRSQYLGQLGGRPCFAAELDASAEAPSGHRFAGLRALYDRLDPTVYQVAGLAFQIQGWDRRHRFCPECREALVLKSGERAKRCDSCRIDFFPQVTPATITLVHDGPRVLMTRQARFPPGMFGLVAGFLEPGETLEACVEREVREETGVAVEDIRYFASQPWPFPHQVMVGFTARFAGGELVVDTSELEDARWFDRSAMPKLPPRVSIARALIDAWLDAG